jgi:hypothetical protein
MTFQSEFERGAKRSREAGADDLPGWDVWVNPTADDRAAVGETLTALRRRIHAAAAEKSRAFEAAASTILAVALWLPAAAEISRQAAEQNDDRLAVDPHPAQTAAPVPPSDSAFDLAPHWPDWIADLARTDGITAV